MIEFFLLLYFGTFSVLIRAYVWYIKLHG